MTTRTKSAWNGEHGTRKPGRDTSADRRGLPLSAQLRKMDRADRLATVAAWQDAHADALNARRTTTGRTRRTATLNAANYAARLKIAAQVSP